MPCSAPSVSYGSTNLYMRGALEAQTRGNLDKARRGMGCAWVAAVPVRISGVACTWRAKRRCNCACTTAAMEWHAAHIAAGGHGWPCRCYSLSQQDAYLTCPRSSHLHLQPISELVDMSDNVVLHINDKRLVSGKPCSALFALLPSRATVAGCVWAWQATRQAVLHIRAQRLTRTLDSARHLLHACDLPVSCCMHDL